MSDDTFLGYQVGYQLQRFADRPTISPEGSAVYPGIPGSPPGHNLP